VQRGAYGPGAALAAALLTAGLAGCTGGPAIGDGVQDSKVGNLATASAAAPGKYRTLPAPCGAVSHGTLRALLPGIEELDEDQRKKAYEGQAAITYDTDRRVGCRWQDEGPEGTRRLDLDFERVVSYDPAVSDDDRAQTLYARKAAEAEIPSSAPMGGEVGEAGTASPSGSATATAQDGEKTAPDTAPRPLDGLGDIAFLDDQLTTTDSDSGVHRDITIVFRSSNVIITIGYDQWSAYPDELPDSEDLQRKARRLASELAHRFDG
jgi:hypothetical protein